MMGSPSVIVVGACNVDLISYVKQFPKPGETVQGTAFSMGFGGKGANQCVIATKLGASTAMISKIGDDTFGKDYLKNIQECGIDCSFVTVAPGVTTGVAPISVNADGENSIVIVIGANSLLTAADVEDAESHIKNAKVILCQREIPDETTKRALQLGRLHGVTTVFNAAPYNPVMDEELFKLSDVFCVNETEAEMATGCPTDTIEDLKRAAETLLKKGCKKVIITLGDRGALLSDGTSHELVSAPSVDVVDTTGAGDAFVGTLGYFLASPNVDILEAVKRSCKVAALSVQKKGTQSSYPSSADLDQHFFS